MSRALRAAVALVAAVFALSACGTFTMGAAAIVDGERIEVETVDQAAQKVVQINPTAQQKTNVAAGIVQLRVLDRLLVELADREGISWTKGDIDSAIDKVTRGQGIKSGQVYTIGLVNGTQVAVPSSSARDYGRDLYIIGVLAKRYGGASNKKTQQKLHDELAAVAQDVGVRVNPRYGSFDAKTLMLRTDKNALWTPAQGAQTGP